MLPEVDKIPYHQGSSNKVRLKLKERIPKGDNIYNDIKDFDGKGTLTFVLFILYSFLTFPFKRDCFRESNKTSFN